MQLVAQGNKCYRNVSLVILLYRRSGTRSIKVIMSIDNTKNYGVDPAKLETAYVTTPAQRKLRVCCYGSSSAKTPVKFLKEAWSLGYILARRGHTTVNGAGSFGCMVCVPCPLCKLVMYFGEESSCSVFLFASTSSCSSNICFVITGCYE